MIEAEKTQGLAVKAVMKEGDPFDEIIKVVKEENIDLLIMLAHEEGHIEHFLFGRDNEESDTQDALFHHAGQKRTSQGSVMQASGASWCSGNRSRTPTSKNAESTNRAAEKGETLVNSGAGTGEQRGKNMKNNPLKQLGTLGQSIWLDYIRRDLIASGGLRRLIEEDGLRGMTSNPSIFEKAIVDSHDYDEDIRAMALEGKRR